MPKPTDFYSVLADELEARRLKLRSPEERERQVRAAERYLASFPEGEEPIALWEDLF